MKKKGRCEALSFGDIYYNLEEYANSWANIETYMTESLTFHALPPPEPVYKRLLEVCADYLLTIKFKKEASWINRNTRVLIIVERMPGNDDTITLEQADKMAVLLSNRKRQGWRTLRVHCRNRLKCIEDILNARGLERFAKEILKKRKAEYDAICVQRTSVDRYAKLDNAYFRELRRSVRKLNISKRRWPKQSTSKSSQRA